MYTYFDAEFINSVHDNRMYTNMCNACVRSHSRQYLNYTNSCSYTEHTYLSSKLLRVCLITVEPLIQDTPEIRTP